MRATKTSALHEAGHAVAAVRLGLRFRVVTALKNAGQIIAEPGHETRWLNGRDAAVMLLSGVAAEMIFMHRGFHTACMCQDSDIQQASRACDGPAMMSALDLVRKNRRSVIAVAGALRRKGCLLESDVIDLIEIERKD